MAGVSVDAINAFAVNARVGEALIDIVLAVLSLSSGWAPATVSRGESLTLTSIQAGPAPAIIDGVVTKISGPTRIAFTSERVNPVNALSFLARLVVTVVDVDLAMPASKANGAVTDVGYE